MRHVAANTLTIVILLLMAGWGVIQWGQSVYTGPGPLTTAAYLEIPRGANLAETTERLEAIGAIESGAIFRIGMRYSGNEREIKAGVYELPAGASMQEIASTVISSSGLSSRYRVTFRLGADGADLQMADLLADDPSAQDFETVAEMEPLLDAGSTVDVRVTVPEGLTSHEIVTALADVEYLTGEIEEVPAEGALAPDTYSFRRGAERQDLIGRMAAAQERILAEAWEARGSDLPLSEPYEALILASIIEKETGVAEERGTVASVFVNRLRRGMRLQTDPTVIYGITQGRERLGRGLRRSELDAPTPYNTYVIEGLPPTPIANPGRASIAAAVQPDPTEYLFFVADGTGGHVFSTSLEEHNRNVARWREIEAQRSE
ncbi:MAG: endolytic transglycosylase MltG [Pseudomonadota bacterium]